MKTRQLSRAALRAASLLAFAGLAACGGGGGTEAPDATVEEQPDAGPSCIATTFGEQDILTFTADSVALWGGTATPALDGGDVFYQIEFYGGIEDSLVETFDLAAGNQDNYRTCAICFRAFSYDATDTFVRQFYQSAGSVTLTTDPLTGQMTGTVTGLELVEVDVAEDYTSTPVEGGDCLEHATLALDADTIPNAWTCDTAAYDDGANCDCDCGVADPDCDIANAPVVGCETGEVCLDAVCTETCDVLATPPDGCTTGTCGYYDATQDVCYTDATLFDAAAIGADCTSTTALFCAVTDTVATGVCDTFVNGDTFCREACNETADCNALEECVPITSPNIAPKGVCVTDPTNETCATALPLVVGTPVDGSTGGATSDYNAGLEGETCANIALPGNDVTYVVTLTQDTAYTFTLDPSDNFDAGLALVGPGIADVCEADPIATCVAGADVGFGGDNETFTFTPTTTGTYYVIVDAWSTSETGAFTLSVTSP